MKIAVCDDDKGCLDSMKRLLAGYPGISRTEYYQDLSQLSEALENGMGYDLVLMDIEWEGMEQDGIAYAAQYNARSPQTWFIFVTAYNDKFSEKIFWEKVNLCGFLVKPVRKEHLEKLLDKVRYSHTINRTFCPKVPFRNTAAYATVTIPTAIMVP
jgi:two-component SAPR family response regulator